MERQLGRREFLIGAGIGLGALVTTGVVYEAKRFVTGESEEEQKIAEERKHILTTRPSEQTISGYRVSYPKREPGTHFLPEYRVDARRDVHTNGDMIIPGRNVGSTRDTEIYLGEQTLHDNSKAIKLNMNQHGETPQWFLLQPHNYEQVDAKADTSVLELNHATDGVSYIGVSSHFLDDEGNPIYQVTRMERYRGY